MKSQRSFSFAQATRESLQNIAKLIKPPTTKAVQVEEETKSTIIPSAPHSSAHQAEAHSHRETTKFTEKRPSLKEHCQLIPAK